jgi:dihydroorotate dehydrogenase electron transfer subunit
MPANRDTALVAREPLEGSYVLLTFHHPEVAREARAGQFVMIKAGTASEPPLRRPFSVLSVDPERETFSLFLKAVGAGTQALSDLRPGDLAQCLGPLGRPFGAPPRGHDALLVAGGYGIAPFYLFSQELMRAGLQPRVFYGGRSAADLQLLELFEELGVPLQPATEDGSLGQRGRVTLPLEAHLDASSRASVLFACGPDAMLHAVARLAERRRLRAEVSLDPWMGCGIGTCLGCVVWIQTAGQERPRYRCACTEGPVFDAATVVWPGDTTSAAVRHGSTP